MRPNVRKPERATPADLAACRQMIRTGSRSFYAASLLLPDAVRGGAYALYAFCRMSDDTIDVDRGGEAGIERLASRLDAVYAGEPANAAVDRALFDAVDQYAIPRVPFDALLEGMAWDASGREYETIEDVYDYAARVAGSVGAMMAALMRTRTPEMVARACDLGVAMQLTNIARDVGEDARNGRLYLPHAWMREAGLDPASWLERPEFNPQIAGVVERLLVLALQLYQRADLGIAGLPRAYRPAIHAARLLYADIGARIAMRGHDSVFSRAIVPTSRKLQLLMKALTHSWRAPPGAELVTPALAQTQFLVDAVGAGAGVHDEQDSERGLLHNIRWVIELFAALDERPRRLT